MIIDFDLLIFVECVMQIKGMEGFCNIHPLPKNCLVIADKTQQNKVKWEECKVNRFELFQKQIL